MRHDHFHHHLTRRDALKWGAAGAAAAATTGAIGTAAAGAVEEDGTDAAAETQRHIRFPDAFYDDEMFDVDAVAAGGYWVSPYGPTDERGTLNELTPKNTAQALRRLQRNRQVKTYQLGESMFNGFPAFPSDPPRLHEMFLFASGYDAGPNFEERGGIQGVTEGIGPNRIVGNEERFDQNFTFQIGSQLDGLNHVGIGTADNDARFYNDYYGREIAEPTGTTRLGNETMGPIVTRAVILDVVGLKIADGKTDDWFLAPNGEPVLRDDYRITIADIRHCLRRQRIRKPIGAGDVAIFHTGWTHLVRPDPARYLAQEPGIYLAESRWFIDRRVAVVASDTWGLEVLDPEVTGGNLFPAHQELLGRVGVRIGESFITDDPLHDHVYEGVICITPENVPGATAGSTPPALLGQPGQAPRDHR